MKQYADCKTLEEFCDKYHRAGCYGLRGKDYVLVDFESHKSDIAKYGETLIPKGTSTTGEAIWWKPMQ